LALTKMLFKSLATLALIPLALAQEQTLPGFYGYASANATYGVEYFYWGFEPSNSNITNTTPIVFWLTGGPGCSSSMANFFENGPYFINPQGTGLIPNPNGWNQDNIIVYIDQPAGTGFSTLNNPEGYVANEDQVAGDFVTFLTNFFVTYPSWNFNPLFIIGESYGGHYVPAIGSAIATIAVNTPGTFNFQGVAVGNGLVDPSYQFASYGPFLYANKKINETELNITQSYVPACRAEIHYLDYNVATTDCWEVLGVALDYCQVENDNQTCNVYNVYAPCVGPLCYNMSYITTFLNTPWVQKQLGVDVAWQACASIPYNHLFADITRSTLPDLENILDLGFTATLYNGNYDLICNYMGTAAYVNDLDFSTLYAFEGSENVTWTGADNEIFGNYRSGGGLTQVVVYAAGHMVPHDQPVAALDLVTRVLNNDW